MQHIDQKELAKRWLISPRTLEQWRWQGRGPRFLKVGGRVLYRLADVEAFEADNLHFNTVAPAVSDVVVNPEDAIVAFEDGDIVEDYPETGANTDWPELKPLVPALGEQHP